MPVDHSDEYWPKNTCDTGAEIVAMMSWRDGRRKLRLKHQRFMLTLDRQLSAVLTGASGQASASDSAEPPSAQSQATGVPIQDGTEGPDSQAASKADILDLGAATAQVSGGDSATVSDNHRRAARSASGCLEDGSPFLHDAEQYGAGRPRPASAPSVLQQATETEPAPAASGQTAAGVAWLPAPELASPAAPAAGNTAAESGLHAVRTISVDPSSNSATIAHVINSFGAPAWGATEVRLFSSSVPGERALAFAFSETCGSAGSLVVQHVSLFFALRPDVAAIGAGWQGPAGVGPAAGDVHRDAPHPRTRPARQRRPSVSLGLARHTVQSVHDRRACAFGIASGS